MMKKLFALLLAVLMVIGMMAACGQQETTDPPATEGENEPAPTPAASTDDDAEPITITIAYESYANNPADPETFGPCLAMEEALGIDINWLDWGADHDSYKEKLDLAMAAGNAPDLFMINDAETAKRYANDELLLCIEDYMADYPNVAKYLDNTDVRNSTTYTSDGKLYTAVRQYSSPVYWFGLLARQDIIDELGVKYDGTIEGFTDMMRALKEKTGTYAFTYRHGPGMFVNMWGPTFGVGMDLLGWNHETGKYSFQGENDRLFNELVWMNQLYSEGLLDPDYALNTTEMWEEKVSNGQGSVTIDYFVRCEQFTDAVRAEDPNAAFEMRPIALPVTKDNFKPATLSFSSVDTSYQLGINVDTQYPDVCMQILNYIYSDEVVTATNYGQEGVTFDYVDGVPTLNENVPTAMNNFVTPGEPIDIEEYKGIRLPIFFVVNDVELYSMTTYGQYSYPGYELYKENGWLNGVSPVIPADFFTSEDEAELADISAVLTEYYNNQIQDFIDGTRPLTAEEYAKFQDECMNEYGAARWCEIMNNAYTAWKG